MPGHTPTLWPYPLATEPVAGYPAVGLELANLLEAGPTTFKVGGMRVQRHPYAGPRHVESGVTSLGSLATGARTGVSVSLTDPMTANPNVAVAAYNSNDFAGGNTPGQATPPATGWVAAQSGSGFAIYGGNSSNLTPSGIYVYWVAEGPD